MIFAHLAGRRRSIASTRAALAFAGLEGGKIWPPRGTCDY
jgi:hypothetical protein